MVKKKVGELIAILDCFSFFEKQGALKSGFCYMITQNKNRIIKVLSKVPDFFPIVEAQYGYFDEVEKIKIQSTNKKGVLNQKKFDELKALLDEEKKDVLEKKKELYEREVEIEYFYKAKVEYLPDVSVDMMQFLFGNGLVME